MNKKLFPRYCCWCGKKEKSEKDCWLYSKEAEKKFRKPIEDLIFKERERVDKKCVLALKNSFKTK